jgi:voltage-dependent potassium channel beta subunit
MEYNNLGHSGLKISPVGLGSWLTFGNSINGKPVGDLTRQALDAGINLIDTADVYALGKSETALGEVLRDIRRGSYVLASKCYFAVGDGPNDRGLSRKHIFESIEGSLGRLQTSYLDLYQCHRFDTETPLWETARAMDDLIRQGKILYWGVSDWTAGQIRDVVSLCVQNGFAPPISNQPPYSMFHRDIETEVLPTCNDLGLGNLVFSPLAQGVLSGKYLPGQGAPEGSRATDEKSNRFIGRYMGDAHLQAAQDLKEIASSLGAPLATMALAWCLRQPAVDTVLVGVTRPEQLIENIAAAELRLDEETLARISSILESLPMVAGE